MADYKGIKGGKIQNFSTNPPAPIVGQVWYNETTVTINYFSSSPAGAWATGTDLNTAKNEAAGAGHTQTSAIAFAGSPVVKALAESWNGSAWTEVGDLNNDRYDPGGAGASNTAALCFGGIAPGFTGNAEKWNGTAWTEVGDLNTARQGFPEAAGTNTAALAIGTGQVGCEEFSLPAEITNTVDTD